MRTLVDLGTKQHTSVRGMVAGLLSKDKLDTLEKFMRETNIYLP